jgi:hypothetical protein
MSNAAERLAGPDRYRRHRLGRLKLQGLNRVHGLEIQFRNNVDQKRNDPSKERVEC